MKTVELLHGIGVPRTVDQGGGIWLKPSWRVAPSQSDDWEMRRTAAADAAFLFRHFGPPDKPAFACPLCPAPFRARIEHDGHTFVDHGEITYLALPPCALHPDRLNRPELEADWLRLLLSIHEQPSDWKRRAA